MTCENGRKAKPKASKVRRQWTEIKILVKSHTVWQNPSFADLAGDLANILSPNFLETQKASR